MQGMTHYNEGESNKYIFKQKQHKKLCLLLFSKRANGIIKQWFLDYFSTFIYITKGDSKY